MRGGVVRRDPSADEVEDRGHAPAGWRRRQRLALFAGLPLIAVLAGLWVERRPIATHVIDDRLAASGVRARYRIADLGPGRQRLTDVVIGDPAHPDLVADWIETQTSIGLTGPALTGVRAGRLRLRGRLVDGRVSLGAIDRLLLKGGGSGGLPALALDIGDARLRLETAAGVVGVQASGRGRLDDGFAGRVALAGAMLASGACRIDAPHALLRVATRRGAVQLTGPVAATAAWCTATRVAQPSGDVDVVIAPADPSWRGTARLAAAGIADPRAGARSLAGSVAFVGRPGANEGTVALGFEQAAAGGWSAARLGWTGRFAAGSTASAEGTLTATGARAPAALVARVRRSEGAANGSPAGPLAVQAGEAMARAVSSFGGVADVTLTSDSAGVRAEVRRAAVTAASGATLRYDGSVVLGRAAPSRVAVAMAGGGLPTAQLSLASAAQGRVEGALVVSRYMAGGAALTLTPIALVVSRDGAIDAQGTATLSGPLGDGAVEGLRMPIALYRSAAGEVLVGRGCAPLSFDRVAVGGLRLDPATLTLCPVDGALVRIAVDGRVGGGARLTGLRLGGRLGASPLTVEAGGASVAIGARGFTAIGVAASLGQPGRQTRFAADTLSGALTGGGVAGSFAGAGGQIGAVPLLLSDAAGKWSVASGALAINGGLTIADADAPAPRLCPPIPTPNDPRFCPLRARDVTMRLADGRITATGTLTEPTTGTRVAGLTIAHDLTSGAGVADLAVEKLSFTKAFQPTLLTPVVRGTIADVAGTFDGEGHLAWSDAGLTSTGRFATAGTDLAAAVGPVTGIAGSIAFTDLLGLVSAPGQQVTVASINPGIPVENGVIRFHTEAGPKVAVENARWPFAGGTLTLEPTLLDFSAPAERHMTFRLDNVAADQFLQQFDFKNLAATGTFDGVLPMIFDAQGGRIENGRLTVREGGGGIAYVGDLAQKDLGFWGNLAFQALKSLRYRSLGIAMNGPLEGEMITDVRFAGVSQGQGAKSNFLIRRLQRLPFVFNVRIRAPFRELVQTTNSFSDPSDLIRRNLPALLGAQPAQAPSVQLGASAPVPEAKRP